MTLLRRSSFDRAKLSLAFPAKRDELLYLAAALVLGLMLGIAFSGESTVRIPEYQLQSIRECASGVAAAIKNLRRTLTTFIGSMRFAIRRLRGRPSCMTFRFVASSSFNRPTTSASSSGWSC